MLNLCRNSNLLHYNPEVLKAIESLFRSIYYKKSQYCTVLLLVPSIFKVGIADELLSINPETPIVFPVKIVNLSVSQPFHSFYSQFIKNPNLRDSESSKAWWLVLSHNVYVKKKVLDD